MPSRTVVLLGPRTDPHLDHVAHAVAVHGVARQHVDTRGAARSLGLRYDPAAGSGALGDVPLDEIGGVYVKALPPRHPHFSEAPATVFSLDEVRVAEAEGGALRDTLCAVLVELAARGIPVLNVPARGVAEQQKPHQLALARRAGLAVPPTLLSCDPAAATAFLRALEQQNERGIAKPVRGGGYATQISVDDDRVASLVRAPVLLQRFIPGEELRAYFLDGELLGAARVTGTRAIDHRADPVYRRGEAGYIRTTLPDHVATGLSSLLRALELRFAAVDLRVEAGTGVHWFLEANAAPAFLEFEARAGIAIAKPLGFVLGRQALSRSDG